MSRQARDPRMLKRAALLLATLGRTDRRWVLDRLPANARGPIAKHVEEVLSLTQGDLTLLTEAAGSAAQGSESSAGIAAKPEMDPALARLGAVLTGLPPILAAAVLKTQPDGWRDSYIRAADEEQRERLREALATLPGQLPPKLTQALQACVATGSDGTAAAHPSFAEMLDAERSKVAGASA